MTNEANRTDRAEAPADDRADRGELIAALAGLVPCATILDTIAALGEIEAATRT